MQKEKRLIDAGALLKTINDTAEGLADCDQQNAAWALRKYAVRDIMDAQTVDAVEVVRCKDCKHRRVAVNSDITRKISVCNRALPSRRSEDCFVCGTVIYATVEENDFCSHGERRSDG